MAKRELTRQYNEGYKVDLAEPHAGPGGCDEVNEIKLWTPLLKTSSPGVGNASSGGCKARGQPGVDLRPSATPVLGRRAPLVKGVAHQKQRSKTAPTRGCETSFSERQPLKAKG